MMEFKDGTSVYTSDGKKAGSLHRVVINPESREITHIVVQKGLLTKEDKVISMDKVLSASEERVAINCSLDELQNMEPLEIEHYVPANENPEASQFFDPVSGRVYNDPTLNTPVKKEIERTIPEELVVFKEGAKVVSADAEHVGNVEHVFADAGTGQVTQFTVSQGALIKTKRYLPIEWVQRISEDEVDLTVGSRNVEELPVIQG
jgi:uncharacterized protein YrrD